MKRVGSALTLKVGSKLHRVTVAPVPPYHVILFHSLLCIIFIRPLKKGIPGLLMSSKIDSMFDSTTLEHGRTVTNAYKQ